MARAINPVRLEEAKALSDELRIIILDMLKEKPMSVLEIVSALKKRGIHKTPNAIRYHLTVLKDAGLVNLTKVGSVLKYSAKDMYYAYTAVSEDSEELMEKIDSIASEIAPMIDIVIKHLLDKYRPEVTEIAKSLKPCEFCVTSHFIEHVVYEIIKRATGLSIAKLSREHYFKDKDGEDTHGEA